MSAHDDAARDTANARADALLAMHARLEAVTAERDELAAKVARVEALAQWWDSRGVDETIVKSAAALRLRGALDANP